VGGDVNQLELVKAFSSQLTADSDPSGADVSLQADPMRTRVPHRYALQGLGFLKIFPTLTVPAPK
jgi:hypothetical protein